MRTFRRDAIWAVLLAAGASTRMGSSKALLPWCGVPLVRFQVSQLAAAGVDGVVVVTGHDAERVAAEAMGAGASVQHNPAYRSGRAGSVRAGAAAVPDDVRAIVLLNVDQPRTASLIRTLIAAHLAGDALLTTPQVGGERGHPLIVDGALLTELRLVDDATEGLRALLRRHAAARQNVAVDDTTAILEFNTPQEYAAVHAAWPQEYCR